MGEPFETLLLLVAEGRIDEKKAVAAIKHAEMTWIVDDAMEQAALEGDEALARVVPAFGLQIQVAGTEVFCMPQTFAHLLRQTIEQPDTLGIPATTTTRICRVAATKMQSTPVDYSFACAEAYWLETLKGRKAAKRTWAPYARINDGEWRPQEHDTLFLEPPIGDNRLIPEPVTGGSASADVAEELAAMVEQGRRERDPDLLYYALRTIALAYAGAGRFEEAQAAFEEAVRLAPEVVEPAGMIVLVGDALRVAAVADDSSAVGAAVERLGELADTTPSRVGVAAVLARTARLLYAVSEPQAAFRCVGRIADCLG